MARAKSMAKAALVVALLLLALAIGREGALLTRRPPAPPARRVRH